MHSGIADTCSVAKMARTKHLAACYEGRCIANDAFKVESSTEFG